MYDTTSSASERDGTKKLLPTGSSAMFLGLPGGYRDGIPGFRFLSFRVFDRKMKSYFLRSTLDTLRFRSLKFAKAAPQDQQH